MVKRGRSSSSTSGSHACQPKCKRRKSSLVHCSGDIVKTPVKSSEKLPCNREMIYSTKKQPKSARKRRKVKSMMSIGEDGSAISFVQGQHEAPSSKHVDSGFGNKKRTKRGLKRRFCKAKEDRCHKVSDINLDTHSHSGFRKHKKGTIMTKKQKNILNADCTIHEDTYATRECFPDCIVHEDKVVTSDLSLDDAGSFYKETSCFLSLPERAFRSTFKKKLLVLDLNGILCDVVFGSQGSHMLHKKINKKSVYKRPFLDDFLAFCFEKFAVGVWSSRNKKNLIGIIDYIIGDAKDKLQFCWDSSKCTITGFNTIDNRHKPLVLKDLSKLWNNGEASLPWEKGQYSQSNTLLVDDSPYKALLNPPHTAIFPFPFDCRDVNDSSLGPGGDIRRYLERVALAGNVQAHVKKHPFGQQALTAKDKRWSFYKNIIDIVNNSSSLTQR